MKTLLLRSDGLLGSSLGERSASSDHLVAYGRKTEVSLRFHSSRRKHEKKLTSKYVLELIVARIPNVVHLGHERVGDEHPSTSESHAAELVQLVLGFGRGADCREKGSDSGSRDGRKDGTYRTIFQ
jgi:hypothetical protein